MCVCVCVCVCVHVSVCVCVYVCVCVAGKWYPEEERRLAQAIYDLTGLKPSKSDWAVMESDISVCVSACLCVWFSV